MSVLGTPYSILLPNSPDTKDWGLELIYHGVE